MFVKNKAWIPGVPVQHSYWYRHEVAAADVVTWVYWSLLPAEAAGGSTRPRLPGHQYTGTGDQAEQSRWGDDHRKPPTIVFYTNALE